MYYEIQDPILGKGKLKLEIVALKTEEGFVLKISGIETDKNISLIWAFGGASGRKFSRDGDIGADPESSFYLKPEYCTNNQYTINKDSFLLEYASYINEWTKDGKTVFVYFNNTMGAAVHNLATLNEMVG
jgi:hypothetical protein